MELRAAAVEHIATPVEPEVAPVDEGSSPSEAVEALSFSRGLAFSPCRATTLPHINEAWIQMRITVEGSMSYMDPEYWDFIIPEVVSRCACISSVSLFNYSTIRNRDQGSR